MVSCESLVGFLGLTTALPNDRESELLYLFGSPTFLVSLQLLLAFVVPRVNGHAGHQLFSLVEVHGV